MSNTNNNPQGGWQSAGPAGAARPQTQPSVPQPQPSRGGRFFAWIRSSRITRNRDRWIAGVCGGVACRLGWNTALVRALVLLTSLLFGAGAVFYALAWFLLPDEGDDRILCEELIHGRWDWNCLGALVCAMLALWLPGVGWVAFGAAVLVFWLLVNRQSYAASLPQPPQPGWPAQPGQPMRGAQPRAGQPNQPTQPQYTQRPMAANAPIGSAASVPSARPAWTPQSRQPIQPTLQQPTQPSFADYRQYAQPAQSPCQMAQQPVNPPSAFATANVPPTFTAPAAPLAAVTPKPKRARRKPAGPLLVLVTLGLALLAIAGTGWYASIMTVDYDYAMRLLRLITLCCGGICLGVGVVIVVLGCVGRRTGGLHPLAWCAAFMAMMMIFCTGMVTLESRDWMIPDDYRRAKVNGTVTWSDTSDAQMKRYERGLVVVGKDYANDLLNIDLSGYPASHGKHKVRLNDGTYGESSCPTGTLNLVAVNVRVAVTLPDGCQWSMGNQNSGYYTVSDYVGGPDGITFLNGTGSVGLFFAGDDDMNYNRRGTNKVIPAFDGTTDFDDSDDSADSDNPYESMHGGQNLDEAFKSIYDNKWYWPSLYSDKSPERPDLFINVDGTVNGSVAMQYASDSQLPLGAANDQSYDSADGKESK